MRLLVLVLAGCLNLFGIAHSQEFTLIRHFDGDIFTLEGSSTEACTLFSSGTASPYLRTPSTLGLVPSNTSCTCQCNIGLPTFREDLQICVNDIHECNVAGFVSNSGQIERVPYVFLPQRGQIIYPHAEIRFEGVSTPVCGIAGAQQLGKAGWFELRNLSDAEPPFRLFRDEGRTFLQWIGEGGLRDAAEGRVVIAKLVCRDASPKLTEPNVFAPCVAFRVAGSPSKNNVREVMFSATTPITQGLSTTEYTAIGLSSVILAFIYVASVSLYLHSRKVKRKSIEAPEVILAGGRESSGLVKSNPLLNASRHFESDTNSGLTESELGDELPQSDGEPGFENVTSAVIHPHCVYLEHPEVSFGSGSIIGERLPEEDVRVVETAEHAYQQDAPVLPGTQRRKLYFNPAYFDRQLLLAPPPAAIEFLLKIREVISIAKHKMTAKRFVPTLIGIPEEERSMESCEDPSGRLGLQLQRRSVTNTSAQASSSKSKRSQRCTGCPGCTESLRALLPVLPDVERGTPGESKVRAWLEDVRPPQSPSPQHQTRHRQDVEGVTRRNLRENARTFAKSLVYLRELAKQREFTDRTANLTYHSLSSWKDNPPMLQTFRNIARSEIIESNDRHSVSKRSTKSMFEESAYDRFNEDLDQSILRSNGNDAINAKVRKAIENSFIKQMEENTTPRQDNEKITVDSEEKEENEEEEDEEIEQEEVLKKKKKKKKKKGVDQREDVREETQQVQNLDVSPQKRQRKSVINSSVITTANKKRLPDMIDELPSLAKNSAKRIMDAVIREMVDAKALDHHHRPIITEYEVDSLERSKCSRKSESKSTPTSTSPDTTTNQSSPALSTALPMDEELTMGNAVIDPRTVDRRTIPKQLKRDILEKNYYNSLPELIARHTESYSLVSEVYVNDGYASPSASDDSGPEIQYEPENPGHLTIKVYDSPENYVKQDESEYEPDTLDRKPMKLKINGDVSYERESKTPTTTASTNEVYIDSLERPAQILLRSKGSFRDEESTRKVDGNSLERGYGSLREIYEARLTIRSNPKDTDIPIKTPAGNSLDTKSDQTSSTKRSKYLAPDSKQARRQRQPHNQPDVVPMPPMEEIYQCPKPPRRVEIMSNEKLVPFSLSSKNGWDRSPVEAGDPTASNGSPVHPNDTDDEDIGVVVGTNVRLCPCKLTRSELKENNEDKEKKVEMVKEKKDKQKEAFCCLLFDNAKTTSKQIRRSFDGDSRARKTGKSSRQCRIATAWVPTGNHDESEQDREACTGNKHASRRDTLATVSSPRCDSLPRTRQNKIEDSGYLSSTDSNGSRRQLLRHDVSSVSETDETESVCDGASESGAESIGTDSVFFGNFRRLSDISNFSKSIDSGVDFGVRNPYFQPFGIRNEGGVLERNFKSSEESEADSFVTVLPPGTSNANLML